MKRVVRFLFERWYGAGGVWLALGVLILGVGGALGAYGRIGGLMSSLVLIHAALSVVMLAAIVASFVKRRWGRAIVQLLLMILSVALYGVVSLLISFVGMTSGWDLLNPVPSECPWYGTRICESLPFAVEFRASHPFLAEYERRIVFKSGKSVALTPDTGGAGDIAVYVLKDGIYYLMDCLDRAEMRSAYLIDAKAETVNRAASAAGDWLKDKRYVGRVTTRGEFVREAVSGLSEGTD